MRVARILTIGAMVAAAGACNKENTGAKVPLGRPQQGGLATVDTSPEAIRNNPHTVLAPAAQAALDSGNKLQRAGKYKEALAQYRLAAKISPANAAPWYGIYMAADKLGMKALADSATAAVNARTTGTQGIMSDSIMRKAHEADSSKKS